MGVGQELAGRRVRCPHCREAVSVPTAPAADLPARAGPPQEGTESIFGDPEDSDDSVIAPPTPRKPVLLPPDPAPRATKPPAPAAQPIAVTPPPTAMAQPPEPADTGNPFAGLANEPPPAKPKSVARPRRRESVARPPVWAWVVMVVLAGYGALMTALAAWGWLR
jgi:hypothetical protein